MALTESRNDWSTHFVLTAFLLTLSCSPAMDPTDSVDKPAVGPTAESPATVHEEFLAICDGIKRSRNSFFGTAQVGELESLLRRPPGDARRDSRIRARLGLEYLRLGNNAGAIRLLAEARELMSTDPSPGLELNFVRMLGLAHLRLGERSNCVDMHGPRSCILPLAEEAIHSDPRGSLEAIELYKTCLSMNPGSTAVQWLLNVAAMTVGRYPDAVPEPFRLPPESLRSSYDIKRFPNIASAVGLDIYQQSGGGLMDDFDGDGLLDIVSSTIDPCGPMNFFHNDGRGRFEDRSAASNLKSQLGGLNTIHADYDNDGDPDLLVLRGGWLGADGRMRNSLLRNAGDGTFQDVTRGAGLAEPAYPTQTAGWADYDNDGDLDLFIGNESSSSIEAPSQLFRNNGDGTFTDVARQAGVENERMAKSVAWGDYDNDGDPDLYISNIGLNRLYRNNGDGTFVDVAPDLDMTGPEGRSFPSWFFDYDNDGNLDLFVAAYDATLEDVASSLFGRPTGAGHPRLYRNLGDGRFREVSREVGLDASCLPMGSNFGDLDNDGYLDLYLGVGIPSYESIAPNLMYRNDRGQRFQDVSYSGGFSHLQKGHGVAFGDLDNDGDQDIFEQMGGAYPGDAFPSVLYENPGHGNHWITLRLEGRKTNRSAIGVRIEVTVTEPEGTRSVHTTVGTGGSFGGSSLRQEIGLGSATSIVKLVITWPTSRTEQVFRDVQLDRSYAIVEGEDRMQPLVTPRIHLGGSPEVAAGQRR
jgi:hypothetical protein